MSVCDFLTMSEPAPAKPERDEATIGQVTKIADYCHEHAVTTPPRDAVERIIDATRSLRQQVAGRSLRERQVIGEAVSEAVREGLK